MLADDCDTSYKYGVVLKTLQPAIHKCPENISPNASNAHYYASGFNILLHGTQPFFKGASGFNSQSCIPRWPGTTTHCMRPVNLYANLKPPPKLLLPSGRNLLLLVVNVSDKLKIVTTMSTLLHLCVHVINLSDGLGLALTKRQHRSTVMLIVVAARSHRSRLEREGPLS